VKQAVIESIKAGYRHIDCAWIYGNQNEIGEAISEVIFQGLVKREDLWITSKLWNDFHNAKSVEPHCVDSLNQLKLDYLDLYLMHWPVTGIENEVLKPSVEETWVEMEKLVQKGLVKSIGVSNFSAKKLEDIKRYATIFPAVNQVELHPLLRQNGLLSACAKLGVHVTAYSPLGSSDSETIFSHNGASLLSHETIVEVAKEVGKSTAQVCIRWALQRGTSVIPKSSKSERIVENFDVTSWNLSEEQFAKISTIEPQTRLLSGTFFLNQNGPYKTVSDLWDE
jgi:diketogulonate reductase-like aldo/keto reductase